MIHFPRQAKLTLEVTLRGGQEQISRKVTVNYPKKLYPFELKQEVSGIVVGFKTMVQVLQKVEKASLKVRRYISIADDETVRIKRKRDRFLRAPTKLKR